MRAQMYARVTDHMHMVVRQRATGCRKQRDVVSQRRNTSFRDNALSRSIFSVLFMLSSSFLQSHSLQKGTTYQLYSQASKKMKYEVLSIAVGPVKAIPGITTAATTRKTSEDSEGEAGPVRKRVRGDDTTSGIQESDQPNAEVQGTNPVNDTIHPPPEEDWYPNWWHPTTIPQHMFFRESGFVLGGPITCDGYACLMLTARDFDTLRDALSAQRKHMAVAIWRNSQVNDINARIETIDAENSKDVVTIQNLDNLAKQTEDDKHHDALLDSRDELIAEVTKKNTERAELAANKTQAIQRVEYAEQIARDLQMGMVYTLEPIFGDLGVLPNGQDVDAVPRVSWDFYEANPNAASKGHRSDSSNQVRFVNPVDRLFHQMNDIGQELGRVEAEFDSFRDSYDLEFHRYIAREQLRLTSNVPSKAKLEARFGPIWLTRHLAISSKMAQVLKAYYDADRALMEAKRNKKLAAPEKALQPDHGAYIEPTSTPGGVAGVNFTATFGQLLPGHKRDGIESWLCSDRCGSVPESALAVDNQAAPSNSDAEDDQSSLAGGWMRAKIEDYERYVGRVPADDSKPRSFAVPFDDGVRAELMKQSIPQPW
jgi:hypothetical protein